MEPPTPDVQDDRGADVDEDVQEDGPGECPGCGSTAGAALVEDLLERVDAEPPEEVRADLEASTWYCKDCLEVSSDGLTMEVW